MFDLVEKLTIKATNERLQPLLLIRNEVSLATVYRSLKFELLFSARGSESSVTLANCILDSGSETTAVIPRRLSESFLLHGRTESLSPLPESENDPNTRDISFSIDSFVR